MASKRAASPLTGSLPPKPSKMARTQSYGGGDDDDDKMTELDINFLKE